MSSRRAVEKITLAVYLRGQHTWTLELLGSTSLSQLATLLCDRVVQAIRPEDYAAYAHMWTFTVGKAEVLGRTKWDSRSRYVSSYGDYAEPDDRDPATRLTQLRLSDRSRLLLEYDMGDTCRVAMKVLRTDEAARGDNLPRWTPAVSHVNEVLRGTEKWRTLMEAVPAYRSPARIDEAYPKLAALVMRSGKGGNEDEDEDEGEDEDEHEDEFECEHAPAMEFLLGLSAMECREDDATFLAVGTVENDLLYAPVAFESIDELLTTADSAIRPDATLQSIRAGWVTHFLFPASLPSDVEERVELSKTQRDDFGPARRYHRMEPVAAARLSAADTGAPTPDSPPRFSFAEAFPRTNAQLTSGRFRWFKYEPLRMLLTVCVGRGRGADRRQPQHVCRAWKAKFDSLHELLCAVEASWVRPDDATLELSGAALVIDDDAGPRCPTAPSPPMLAGLEAASVLRPPASAGVTSLLLAAAKRSKPGRVWHAAYAANPQVIAAGDVQQVIFVGTSDGHIEKWTLEPPACVWRVLAHVERAPDDADIEALYLGGGFNEDEDAGEDEEGCRLSVNGLLLSDDGERGATTLFSWANEHRIGVWRATDGASLSEDGNGTFEALLGDFAVAINCVVLVRQPDGTKLLLAGLHCEGAAPGWVSNDQEEPDEDEGSIDGADFGNLLPFIAGSGKVLDAWCGHQTPVVALAATAGGHVASCGSIPPHAHNLLLWNTEGMLLRQVVFNPLPRQPRSMDDRFTLGLVNEVNGAAVHGSTLLLMTEYGGGLLVVDLEQECVRGKLRVGLAPGYEGGGFKCCLASSANFAVGANSEDHEGAGGWGVSDPENAHGTALVVDLRSVLGSPMLEMAEGEGEEQEGDHMEQDERDFCEEKPEPGLPDRHRGIGVGYVATALRDGALDGLAGPTLESMHLVSSHGEPPQDSAATMLAISPGWLATGYTDGAVRLQRLPEHVAWAHEPGSNASAVHNGSELCDRCNWHFPSDEDVEYDY